MSCGKPAPGPGIPIDRKTIVGRQLYPNVMVLLDRSAAMSTNTSTASPCPATIGGCGPGNPCPAGCPTRLGDVQASLGDLLASGSGATFRVGVSVFPADNACLATGNGQVLLPLLGATLHDDPAQLQTQSAQAKTVLEGVSTQGGMATSDSLRFIGSQPELSDPDRQNFVMLFTSGAPGCNSSTAEAVAAVSELRAKNIKTIVIAVGADPASYDALNQMAIAGGFARACPSGTDAECAVGGASDTCEVTTKICHQAFFAAADAAQLSAQLTQMTAVVPADVHCNFALSKTPSSVSLLEVSFDGALMPRCLDATGCNTWTFDAASNQVVFQGSACGQIKNATQAEPVTLEFKISG